MTVGGVHRLVAACAASSLCAVAAAQPGFGPGPLELEQVQEDLYVIRSAESGPIPLSNVTVLVSDGDVLLIDDKFEFDYDNVMAELAEITDEPVDYVINTHHHPDHSGGNEPMQAADAVILASENARRNMLDEGRETGLPKVTLENYLRMYVGDEPVDIHYFGRAHTNGDVVVHLPERDVVVVGDIFAAPGVQLIDYPAGGSARDWPRTIDEILKLRFDTVIPGHAAVTDRAALEAYRDETLRLNSMVTQMNDQDRSRDEIEAMLRSEFGWSGLFMDLALDGVIQELR